MQHLEHIDDFIGMRAQQEAAIKIAAAGTPESRSLRRRFGGSSTGSL